MSVAAINRLVGELDQELALYRGLVGLLEDQYQTATRVDTAALNGLSETIAGQVGRLEARRQMRSPRLLEIVALIDRAARGGALAPEYVPLQQRCHDLRRLAGHCKALSARNGELLATQYESLRQVLYGDIHTYAPL